MPQTFVLKSGDSLEEAYQIIMDEVEHRVCDIAAQSDTEAPAFKIINSYFERDPNPMVAFIVSGSSEECKMIRQSVDEIVPVTKTISDCTTGGHSSQKQMKICIYFASVDPARIVVASRSVANYIVPVVLSLMTMGAVWLILFESQ